MATTLRRPLPTLKVKKLPPPRLPSPEKAKTGRDLDPLEKRLINIRLHLLHNTKRRTQTPSEPTLVFDSFLYLGGLKSLSNKVCFYYCLFFLYFLLFRYLDSSCSSENNSHYFHCFHPASKKSHRIKYQTSFFKS
jgi:hypothetical protein